MEDPPPGSSLVLLHFNDVYELESRTTEPAGGAARCAWLAGALRDVASANACPSLTVFSGDALNPSLLSTVTRGKHMVGALNGMGVDVACMGNHGEAWWAQSAGRTRAHTHRPQSAGHRAQGAGRRAQSAGCRTQGAERRAVSWSTA